MGNNPLSWTDSFGFDKDDVFADDFQGDDEFNIEDIEYEVFEDYDPMDYTDDFDKEYWEFIDLPIEPVCLLECFVLPGAKLIEKLIKVKKVVKYADPKFAEQLKRQLTKDGLKSVKKSLKKLERRLQEHKDNVGNYKYKSSVEREIRTFQKQVDTAKKLLKTLGE